jgi:hypothetical protein
LTGSIRPQCKQRQKIKEYTSSPKIPTAAITRHTGVSALFDLAHTRPITAAINPTAVRTRRVILIFCILFSLTCLSGGFAAPLFYAF